MSLEDQIPKNWKKLLANGWKIVETTCDCGGNYAWLEPAGWQNKSYEMVGCVCCTHPTLDKEIISERKINLTALQTEAEKLLSLLKNPEYGLITYNRFLFETIDNIRSITS